MRARRRFFRCSRRQPAEMFIPRHGDIDRASEILRRVANWYLR